MEVVSRSGESLDHAADMAEWRRLSAGALRRGPRESLGFHPSQDFGHAYKDRSLFPVSHTPCAML